MADIVSRLRDQDAIVLGGLFHAVPVMLDAANIIEKDRAVLKAATNLLADVRRRYPGEELRCPYMIALDAALKETA